MWIVYILQLKDNSYYTGITNNLEKRLIAHKNKKGSKYVAARLPLYVVYKEYAENRSAASIREAQIKKMTKDQKKKLIKEEHMSFPVRPLYDQVFIDKDDESMTTSGLHLPQSTKGRAVIGTVLAVGPGLLSPYTGGFLPMSVKEGDKVFIREFSGQIIKYKEFECHCMKENEIVGVVMEEEESRV